MTLSGPTKLDAVVFGGGAAGLWLLDELRRKGYQAVLLESGALGSGQTIGSQGIIHGGMKYSLSGLVDASAKAIRLMPELWRRCLAGEGQPDLSDTRIRAQTCHLWRTKTLRSRLGLSGAKAVLRVAPVKLPKTEWPDALRGAGDVLRLDEQVIDPASFLQGLAQRHREFILQIDAAKGLDFSHRAGGPAGVVETVYLRRADSGQRLTFRPRFLVLTAGKGNGELREKLGLSAGTMQMRPLHMAAVRGNLPELNGHCADGAHTRVTVTTADDAQGRRIWQVGGQVSEDGVAMEPMDLIRHARKELEETVTGVDLGSVEWMTYHVVRAEVATPTGKRPEREFAGCEGNVITAWPTKLVLAPVLAGRVMEMLGPPGKAEQGETTGWADWPHPKVAKLPWEAAEQWYKLP
ncbi:MAG: FAD-dependent oxidoreductase [Phycisphaeraceae bacterium]|nr:FAD-dependent oxidoreductase [Phycisphaeraceae bacterium]